ncbi:MAG TPA: hypothetical protein VGH28_07775 [Polyangiaceae bacterium]|jgi:hypothetical protein
MSLRNAALALVLLAPCGARAEDDAACQRAYVAGQRLYKLDHDFLGARAELLVCAKTCPDELRDSCGRWLEEIARDVPSIVVRALDKRGHDVPDARVDVDGRAIAVYVEGQPIELNAGRHELTVHRGAAATRETIVLAAGEKLRVVDVWTEPREATTFVVRRPVPAASWALLAIGAVGLASFGVFATWTTAEFSDTSACTPNCSPASKDASFDTKTAIADVSLGVGLAALVAAGIVYLARPTLRVERRVTAAPWVLPGGAGFALGGAF